MVVNIKMNMTLIIEHIIVNKKYFNTFFKYFHYFLSKIIK